MSASTGLTREEFCSCFPLVADLKHEFIKAGQLLNWGLCTNVEDPTKTAFGFEELGVWKLAYSFSLIANYARNNHPNVPLESLFFCHEVNVRTLEINCWMVDERDANDRVLDTQQALTHVFRKNQISRTLH